MSTLKLMVMGHGRHGKDTVSDLLAQVLELRWQSSSWFAAERLVFPRLRERYSYADALECYRDRHNHRVEWFTIIREYNQDDSARFSRDLFAEYDIYCGIRNRHELLAARDEGLYDLGIWVDASERHPSEDEGSCTVTSDLADIIIDNNSTLHRLQERVYRLAKALAVAH